MNSSRGEIPSLSRFDWMAALAIFIASLALYARTVATTLLLGDSAEFQVLIYTLGLAHPTGYPIYLLLGKIFTLLVPLRDIAYRANLFSAFCAALTVALVYLLVRALGGKRIAALLGGFVLSVSWLFWWHAAIAEVYDPAAALVALILLLVVRWRATDRPRLLFWAGLAGGLSVGVHYTVLLAAPAVGLFVLLSAKPGRRKPAWVNAAAGVLLGLSICFASYFALNAVDSSSSAVHSVLEPSTSVLDTTPEEYQSPMGRFIYLVTGRQFQGELGHLSSRRVVQNLAKYFEWLPGQFSRPVLALAGIGLLALLVSPRRVPRWRELLLLLITWAAMVLYVINYDIGDDFVFYIPTYVLLAAAAGAGASAVQEAVEALAVQNPRLGGRRLAWISGAAGLVLVVVGLFPAYPVVVKSWKEARITFLDSSGYRDYPYPVKGPSWPRIEAKAVAKIVEDNAIIFTDWGRLYPIYYIALVEQGRTGIEVHETYPAMTPKPFADSARKYIQERYSTRPIYFAAPVDELTDEYRFAPVGSGNLLYRLVRK